MTATLPHVTADQPAVIASNFSQYGTVIVDDLLEAERLDRFNRQLDPIMDSLNPGREFLNPTVAFFFGDQTDPQRSSRGILVF